MKYTQIVGALLLLSLCNGCAALFVGAAAGAAGGTAGGLYLNESKREDDVLAERVKNTLANHPQLGQFHLDASAEDGLVKIYGFVPHPAVEAQALQVVQQIQGVKGVVSRMTIVRPGTL